MTDLWSGTHICIIEVYLMKIDYQNFAPALLHVAAEVDVCIFFWNQLYIFGVDEL